MPTEVKFPDNFCWGASTASYQIEGAVDEDGRGDSIWDAFSRTPGKTVNGDTGAVAVDHYHRYKEDVQVMKQMGLKHYRLSVAWPRIIPSGVGAVNEKGVKFYNNLIDELLANGIQPLVTLYHWDLPLALQTEYDGWLGGEIIQHAFVEFSRVCFERFGDRVKTWITINEPFIFSQFGYGAGFLAPGRKHNKHFEPYVVGHNLLLAHARAVDLYRREFQSKQGGRIGITYSSNFVAPKPTDDLTEKQQNEEAAERAMIFHLGWFADPVYLGDYPKVMRDRCGDRLPEFTEEQKQMLKGSSDFFGLNSYSTHLATPTADFMNGMNSPNDNTGGWDADSAVSLSNDPTWKVSDVGWGVVPWGFKNMLLWIQKRYNPVNGIYITENGMAWPSNTKEEALNDDPRVDYYRSYIAAMKEAMDEGADVRAYYAWSFIDNYEWSQGYDKRFGLVWVNYETMERVIKKSGQWYAECMRNNGFQIEN